MCFVTAQGLSSGRNSLQYFCIAVFSWILTFCCWPQEAADNLIAVIISQTESSCLWVYVVDINQIV